MENEEQYFQQVPSRDIKSIQFHDKIRKLGERGHAVPDVVEYPTDPLRLVVRNQLILHLDKPLEVSNKSKLRLTGKHILNSERKAVDVVVTRACRCNPLLVLVEGEQVHLLADGLDLRYSPEQDTSPPHVIRSSANDIEYSPEQDTSPPHVIRSSSGGGGRLIPLLPASFDEQLRRIQRQHDSLDEYPIVAVMDTGIDFRYPNTENLPTYYNTEPPTCDMIEPDYIGWDFINDHNYPYDDNETNKHGSRISAIISRIANGNVRIMPLKVIDSQGIGSLFAICCACEYLLTDRLRGNVKAVNASWGFYSAQENELLGQYIDQLTESGTWFINAAGNRGDIIPGGIVDLGTSTRYPACYGGVKKEGVLTVTTVSNKLRFTLPNGVQIVYDVAENFSSTFTDIGVGAGRDSKFQESLVTDSSSPFIIGSSYATAYATGFAALLRPEMSAGKAAFLQSVPGNLGVPALNSKIRDGYVFVVESDPLFAIPIPS